MTNWPFVLLCALDAAGLGYTISKHGQKKIKKYDAWSSLIAMTIELGLTFWAITWGFK